MTTSGELHGYAKAMRREMTPAERLLWNRIRNRQIKNTKFRRQHPFGRFIFDFFALEVGLVIEVDGGIHQRPEQQAWDVWRDDMSVAQRLTVLRFTNAEVEQDIEGVLARIATVVEELRAALTPGPSPEGEG